MSFSLEIRDPSRLIIVCDSGCEDAVQMLSSAEPAQPQPPGVPVVWARVSRDPATGRLLLRLSCDCGSDAPKPAVSANDRHVRTEAQADAPLDADDSEDGTDEAPDEAADEAPDEAPDEAADEAADEAPDEAADEAADETTSQQRQRGSNASSEAPLNQPPSYASALEEFVATERTYVRRLALVFDLYYPGLLAAVQSRQLGCCSAEDLKRVFGHFQGMRLLHEQLLTDLMQSGRLGKLMSQYAHQLKSYGTYYSMFPQITGTVRGWMTDEAFRQVFAQLRLQCADPSESQLDLRALLLEPVQRPMRYPMLLDRYLAEIGSSHPDWQSARRAADIVMEGLHELEKSLRDFAAFQDRLQLLRSVAFPAGLTAHWEEFAHSCLRHGRARQGAKQRYLLLSRHTLLICSPGRFRPETWAVKRAVSVPGDLRVLGCEGNLLRMDTARDPQLHLEFGDPAGPNEGDVGTGVRDGVRDCRDWATELRRLGVPFVDSPSEGDDGLMPWERAGAGRTGRPVMTPLDKATRCQACGCAYRPLQRRRLSCRVCGGAFCADCTDYQACAPWAGDRPLRCCLFCRVAAGAQPAELASERHRDLLARFRAVRALDADPDTLAGQALAWLSGRWVPVWCRADVRGRQLSLFRHRRDFLPVLAVQAPRLRLGEAAPDELQVHDHERRRDYRLRAAGGDGGGGGDDGGLLAMLADRLGRCNPADDVDCVDGVLPTSPAPLQASATSAQSPQTPERPLTPLEGGDGPDTMPEPW